MIQIASAISSMQRFLAGPPRPTRMLHKRRVRLFAAVGAATAAALALVVSYYLTLGLLPPAFGNAYSEYPNSAWAHRLDLAQFLGTFLYPPLPTALTWWLGLAAMFGTLVGLGVVYAILLAWSLQTSDTGKGLGLGFALFLGLGLTLTIANGFHPAVMRGVLPDPGLFLLGWSAWATLQLLVVHVIYGAVLGTLYGRWSRGV